MTYQEGNTVETMKELSTLHAGREGKREGLACVWGS